ncbi:SusC/RagA family TonB-linked outer membrane protein [Pedobacter hiemivivus]|uniref:SusC/RagA family TonB-linked outer membrane protein n=1 Tax=Pedobacter hiemivivus TaxID=2530454 RepID=A0A4R0MMM0_9SPHI|nr:SusC/RagA family TonB-linked outer membrane protein [Pedobacter hiemivivus]TCC87853.1 SusC/RagA family TonB-linked outer membrane protein [Pedobacter hiemivivus]
MYKINFMNRDALMNGIHKTFFIMRLIIIIILIAVIQLSAKDSNGQKLTYNKNNATIREIFKEIKRQTGYNVIWYEGKLNSHMPIDVNFYNTPLNQVLDNVLDGRSVTYQIIGKAIVVKAGEPAFRDNVISTLATIDVRGRVLDENNDPLVGAVVKVKGGSASTSTNLAGEFLLRNVDEKAILVISFVGYVTKEAKAAKRIEFIKLTPSNDKLEEVEINAGYYKVTERERTGSISRITSKDIEKQPVNNVLAAMQANIPGIQIVQTTGVPGGGFTVQIRGRNSIAQGSNPFYMVDGIPFNATSLAGAAGITANANPIANINPNDIESIEVLKDADATAIYGSRGANGVILITTKKGKSGKTITSISMNQGISRVGKMMDFMNTQQYLEMRNEAYFINDKLTNSSPIYASQYDINGTWDQNKYTNWQKELIGSSAPLTNIQATSSGGTNNITYLMGANYFREGTVFSKDQSYKRASSNLNLQYTSDNKKLNISLGANYSQINSNLLLNDLTSFITLPPNYPNLLTNDGLLNWGNNTMNVNPMAQLQKQFEAKTNNLIGHAQISYKIISDLRIQSTIGYNLTTRKEFDSQPLATYNPANNPGPAQRVSVFRDNSADNWNIEAQADYNKKIGLSTFSALAGLTFQEGMRDQQAVTGSGYASDALMRNIASASVFSTSASFAQYRYTAVFGRLNYNYNSKYLINATARRDGSSRFGPENRFANFGALGAAWLISEESLIKKYLSFISFLKLRGSYGITGNDQINDYGYLELWRPTVGSYQNQATISPSSISNPTYAWELNKKAELGLETGFFNNRLELSINYYSNRSSNLLVSTSLPRTTGFSGITDNLPAKVSNEGWEYDFSSQNINNAVFKWNTSFNLTIPKNKLISFPNIAATSYNSQYAVGEPLSILKLYDTFVDPITGLYQVDDFNEDGIVDNKDKHINVFVGRRYYGGIQNSFSYKGFSFDFLFQFVKQTGKSLLSGLRNTGSFSVGIPGRNQPSFLVDRWTFNQNTSIYQKYSTLSSADVSNLNATSFGSYGTEDASFIRLKNVSLSYTVPEKISQRLKIGSTKFFLQGQNLLTITKYKGLDPETLSIANLPTLQIFIIGIQITL